MNEMRPPPRPKDKAFFKSLGARLAMLRKERGITQVQLAAILECSQQQILAFEKGRCRVPVNALPALAEAFDLSLEDLLGTRRTATKPGPASKLQRQLEVVSKLPRSQQRFVSRMLDIAIQQAQA